MGRTSRWGSPFRKGQAVNFSGVFLDEVAAFRVLMTSEGNWPYRAEARQALQGKDLACWCPLVDKDGNHVPCHADVLLEIANEEG